MSSTENYESSMLASLADLLGDKRPEIRLEALGLVAQLCTDTSQFSMLVKQAPDDLRPFLEALLHLCAPIIFLSAEMFFVATPKKENMKLNVAPNEVADTEDMATQAIKCLVNLCSSSEAQCTLSTVDVAGEDAISLLLRLILNPFSHIADYACMLLSNITHNETHARRLASLPAVRAFEGGPGSSETPGEQKKNTDAASGSETHESRRRECVRKVLAAGGETSGGAVVQLVELFATSHELVKGTERRLYNLHADFSYLASVFNNVAQVRECRDLFLLSTSSCGGDKREVANEDTSEATATALSWMKCFLHSKDIRRRTGVAYLVKNLVLGSAEKHDHAHFFSGGNTNNSVAQDVLERLAGGATPAEAAANNGDASEEYSFEWLEDRQLAGSLCVGDEGTSITCGGECELDLQVVLVETLLGLTVTRRGREELRCWGAYPIVHDFHRHVPKDAAQREYIDDIVQRVVSMLMRDEAMQKSASDCGNEVAGDKGSPADALVDAPSRACASGSDEGKE